MRGKKKQRNNPQEIIHRWKKLQKKRKDGRGKAQVRTTKGGRGRGEIRNN